MSKAALRDKWKKREEGWWGGGVGDGGGGGWRDRESERVGKGS